MSEPLRIAKADGRREPRKINFTKRMLDELVAPEHGQRVYYDTQARGLCLMLTPGGAKTFYRYGRIDGRPRRVKIGSHPEISIETARRVAAKLTGQVADGKDPAADRRQRREAPTLGAIFDRFLEEYAKPRKRSWHEDELQFKRYLSEWRPRRLRDIRKSDVRALHAKIGTEHGIYAANRMIALLSRLYSYAADLDEYAGQNPASRVKKFQEESRSRFLNADELGRFWKAVEAEENPTIRDFFKMALLTGGRRAAVCAMRWSDLDLDAGRWTVPAANSKSRREMTLPVPAAAVTILRERRQTTEGEWVFPSIVRRGKHLIDPYAAWRRIRTAAGIVDTRLHDLRRTSGSWQAMLGASGIIIGQSLGHAPGSTATKVYTRLHDDPVRQSIDAATTAMLAATKTRKPRSAKGACDAK